MTDTHLLFGPQDAEFDFGPQRRRHRLRDRCGWLASGAAIVIGAALMVGALLPTVPALPALPGL